MTTMLVIIAFVLGAISGIVVISLLTVSKRSEPNEYDDLIRKIYSEIIGTIEKEIIDQEIDGFERYYMNGLMEANNIVIRTFRKYTGAHMADNIEIKEMSAENMKGEEL